MLDRSLVTDVLAKALSMGGDFAEIFVENTKKNSITVLNGVVEKAISGVDYGCGIRVFNGFNAIYAYTTDTSKDNLLRVAKECAGAIALKNSQVVLNFTETKPELIHDVKILPQDVSKQDICDALRLASEHSFNYSPLITQTNGGYLDVVQDVLIANSEGLWVTDRRVRTRLLCSAVASSETEKQTGRHGPGASRGFEHIQDLDIKALAEDSARQAVTMLKAEMCPSGKMMVVLENDFGGVIFHEACGHSLEATSVAKNASVFANKMGEKIASDLVTAIDDGTMKNAWGSQHIDDEGTKMQRNVLIENGTLKSFLVDKLNGRRMGMASTGSSRRESYRLAPTSRMTNTYIDNGKSEPKDIISNTEYGLYAKNLGGGSVQPTTGEFNFAVSEGYIIRNGKICEPVRGATLIGKGHEVLLNIDMVGNNLGLEAGVCGSISGSVPTNVGQPTIRVKEILVGGRG